MTENPARKWWALVAIAASVLVGGYLLDHFWWARSS